ncbi:MAG: GNAT family N-acetyltransferase [Blastocatellia bacterium]
MKFNLDAMTPSDWEQVCAIYAEGVATDNATFETEAPGWAAWDLGHLPECRLVARAADRVIGWASLSAVSRRKVYAGVAEVSIYIAADVRGRGVGDTLMAALVAESEAHGFWTLQSAVFQENQASVKLHLRHGFREVGRRERIAKRDGVWRDTIIFERRSRIVGVE